jgi:hypothetical protein
MRYYDSIIKNIVVRNVMKPVRTIIEKNNWVWRIHIGDLVRPIG